MKRKKAFGQYAMRYFVCFLLVFASSSIAVAVANVNIRNYIIESNISLNKEGIERINEAVKRMELIGQLLQYDESFTKVAVQQGSLKKDQVTVLSDAGKLFQKASYVTEEIPYAFVVFKNNDMFLSTKGCSFRFEDEYKMGLFGISCPGAELTDSEKVREFLLDSYQQNKKFLVTDYVEYMEGSAVKRIQGPLVYLVCAPSAVGRVPYVACFSVRQDFIVNNILSQSLTSDGFLYICDKTDSRQLLTYGQVPEDIKQYQDGDITADGNYYVIVNNKNELNWEIITGVSLSFIREQTKPVSNLLVMYLGVGLLFLLGMTIFLSVKRYRGMRELIVALSEETSAREFESKLDEYGVAEKIRNIRKSEEEYRLQREELQKQNIYMFQEHVFTKGVHSQEEKELFDKYFMRRPDFFCVAVVRIYQKNRHCLEDVIQLILLYLEARFENRFTHICNGVNEIFFLLELKSSQKPDVQNIALLFEEIVQKLECDMDDILHVGISTIGCDICNINTCYEQAQQIVRAQIVYEDCCIVKTYDITSDTLLENVVRPDYCSHLYALLVQGQWEEIERFLKQLVGHYTRMPYLFEVQKQMIYWSLRNVLYTAWLDVNCEETFEERCVAFKNEMTCAEILEGFTENFAWFCNYLSRNKTDKKEEFRKSIMDYLHNHYQCQTLSINSISEVTGMSERYLSNFFREQIGESFPSVVMGIRVEKAKEYLKNTDYNNEKIAELVGFGTVNSFYRSFKEKTGFTPGKFKEGCLLSKS